MFIYFSCFLQLVHHTQTCSCLQQNVYATCLCQEETKSNAMDGLRTNEMYHNVRAEYFVDGFSLRIHFAIKIRIRNLAEERCIVHYILRQDHVGVKLPSRQVMSWIS